VQVIGSTGERTMPLKDLYRDDGAAHLALAPGDLLARVAVPPPSGPLLFEKLRQRGGIDFPLASVAVAALAGRVRIALSGTNSQPVAFELDAASTDAAVRAAVLRHADCMRTTTTAAHYRREATAAIAMRLVARATQRKGAT
jgi:4-hydroxybenzoyl-CoA reductase subunit beta